jgi:hypothetical protein
MSRVLSLSLADALYDKVSEHAVSQGLTVYQYVRRAIEMRALADDHILEVLSQYDDEPGE